MFTGWSKGEREEEKRHARLTGRSWFPFPRCLTWQDKTATKLVILMGLKGIIKPLLEGQPTEEQVSMFFWHYPHYGNHGGVLVESQIFQPPKRQRMETDSLLGSIRYGNRGNSNKLAEDRVKSWILNGKPSQIVTDNFLRIDGVWFEEILVPTMRSPRTRFNNLQKINSSCLLYKSFALRYRTTVLGIAWKKSVAKMLLFLLSSQQRLWGKF